MQRSYIKPNPVDKEREENTSNVKKGYIEAEDDEEEIEETD